MHPREYLDDEPANMSHPPASEVVSCRLPGPLHALVCEAAGAETPGTWLRALAAERLSYDLGTPVPSRPRRRHRPPSQRQADIREAVRTLGALGAAVVETGMAADLAAEIRAAVADLVQLVSKPR